MDIQCQKAVRKRMQRGAPLTRQQCQKRATWNVTVHVNSSQKPLVADNYDTSKLSHDYFVCGTHKNVLMKEHDNPNSVWIAAATALPRSIR